MPRLHREGLPYPLLTWVLVLEATSVERVLHGRDCRRVPPELPVDDRAVAALQALVELRARHPVDLARVLAGSRHDLHHPADEGRTAGALDPVPHPARDHRRLSVRLVLVP